jgi:hypothetical protein
MPQSLSNFELIDIHNIIAQGFFNQEEKELEDQVVAAGYGYFRCVQLLTGAFISVEKVTEITEDEFEIFPDRLVVTTDQNYILYIKVT